MSNLAYLFRTSVFEVPQHPEDWRQQFVRVYEDFDPQRPQLQQLLADVSQTPPEGLVIQRLDDLGDSIAEVVAVVRHLETLNIPLQIIEESGLTDTASQSSLAQWLETFQQTEQRQRQRRLRQGHAHRRLKGSPPPGRAPYGYRRGKHAYLLDRSVAPVLRDFFDQFLLYGSLRGAVRHIAKQHGKRISVSTGQRWLTHPVYRGDLLLGQQDIVPDTHEAILSRDEAAQVDRLLRRNRSLAPRAASAPRSLAGLVTCQTCESAMTISRVTIRRKATEYLYLRPINCPRRPKCKALDYYQVLAATITAICDRLPKAVAHLEFDQPNERKAALQQAIQAKEAAIAQLPNLVNQHILDQQTADLRTYTLQTEIAAARQKLAQFPPVDLKALSQTVAIPQFWQDLSEEERRFYFREFIRTVQIQRDQDSWQIQLCFMF